MPGVRIYFIEMVVPHLPDHERPIKIGITQSKIQKRLSNLQTSSPYPLRLLGFTQVCRACEEDNVHRRFQTLHLKGEWFRGEEVLRNYIKNVSMMKSKRYPQGVPVR